MRFNPISVEEYEIDEVLDARRAALADAGVEASG